MSWQETEFGKVPSDWGYEPLENYLDLITYGFTNPMPTTPTGVYMVTAKEIFNGRLNLQIARFTSEEAYSELLTDKSRPIKDDVLITKDGSIGRVAIVGNEKICISQSVALMRPAKDRISPIFLKYLLESKQYQALIDIDATGSTIQHIYITKINKMKIAVPTLSEQQAIASALSSLDDKIDLLHRQNKTLEAMAETLFRQWFIEEAKEDWEEVPLSDYFKVKHGYAFKGEFITSEPTNYRLVTPGNFEIGGGFKSAKFKYYSSDVIPEDYVFNELDFVVTMTDLSKEGDTLGYPAFIPLHHKADVLYLHNQRVGKVQFYDEKECKFFFYMLMKQDVYQQFIVGSCTGTSVKHTSPTMIGSFTFAKPPQEKMHDFDRIVGQKFAKIFVNQKQIQTLENLRDTLLPKLMSGEVRVQYQTEEVA